jgi:hypothetical protein
MTTASRLLASDPPTVQPDSAASASARAEPVPAMPAPAKPAAAVAELPDAPTLFRPLAWARDDETAYQQILARIVAAVRPRDILEELWMRDVVDLVWEAFRLRRLKAALMWSACPGGIAKLLSSMTSLSDAHHIAAGWAAGNAEAMDKVDSLLDRSDFSWEEVKAETLAERIDQIERIDRMTARAEARRSAALRGIERHRKNLAAELRRASDEMLQNGFEDIPQAAASPGRTQ